MLQVMTAKTVKQKYTPNIPPPADKFYAGIKKKAWPKAKTPF
jgi:hypothetical protein